MVIGWEYGINGKRLCEGGALITKWLYKNYPEKKPFSFFKNDKKFNERELQPCFCKTDAICRHIFYTFVTIMKIKNVFCG